MYVAMVRFSCYSLVICMKLCSAIHEESDPEVLAPEDVDNMVHQINRRCLSWCGIFTAVSKLLSRQLGHTLHRSTSNLQV